MLTATFKIILASSSPRRQELLTKLGVKFEIKAPELDESPQNGEKPVEHVLRLSLAKANAIAESYPDCLVIGADTVVVADGAILGKPGSPAEAESMLRLLSGRPHVVYTGLSLVFSKEGIARSDYDATRVVFNDLEQSDILKYVQTGEPLDKAGAYGIQGMGSFLVHHYEGEFDTVIGFPTRLFNRMFEEVNSCRNR